MNCAMHMPLNRPKNSLHPRTWGHDLRRNSLKDTEQQIDPQLVVGQFCILGGSLRGFLGFHANLVTHGAQDHDIWTHDVRHWIVAMGGKQIFGKYLLTSFSSFLNNFSILSPTSPSGTLTSSLVSPPSVMRDRKPSSVTSSWEKKKPISQTWLFFSPLLSINNAGQLTS